MSANEIVIDVTERTKVGKGLQTLRTDGQVPAVLHESGKDSLHLQADFREMMKMFKEAGKHHPVYLKIGKTQHMALVKDVDFEPTKHRMRHVVFQAIKKGVKTTAEIPVVFKEDAEIPAERAALLVLKTLDYVEVEALPKDLPDELVVDPSSLVEVGDTLTVADIVTPNGVEILTEAEHGIATVETPRDQLAEADAAADDLAEDAEGSSEVPSEQGVSTEGDDSESTEDSETTEAKKDT
jgi:large subunit ribosomal protein L25